MDLSIFLTIGLIVLIIAAVIIVGAFSKFDVDDYSDKIKEENQKSKLNQESKSMQAEPIKNSAFSAPNNPKNTNVIIGTNEIEKLENLIGKGSLEKAISEALLIYSEHKHMKNELMLLQSRYGKLMREKRLGTISVTEADSTRNQITQSFIEIVFA